MAITTDTTVDIMYSGVAINSYGLSDTLDNYTIDDILNYVYCSASHRGLYGFYGYAENANIMDYNSIMPFSVIKGNSGRIILDVPRGSSLPMPQGAYEYIVWLQKASSGTLAQVLTTDNISDYKMVTEMPANKLLYELPNPAGTKDNITSWSSGTGSECYATGTSYGSLSYVHTVGGEDNLISIPDTHPYMLIKQDNTVFFWRINMESVKFYCRPFSHGVYGVMYVGGKVHTAFDKVKYSAVGNNMLTLDNPSVLPYEWSTGTGSSTSSNPAKWGTCQGDNIVYARGGGNQADVLGTFRLEFSINTKDKALLFWAGCGVRFKAGDTTYKPIIEGGYVTGYTDNLNEPSELDDWTGSTKHTVPSGPPGPPGPTPGEWDDMPGSGSSIGALAGARCYICSKTDITNLKNWMSKTEADGGPPDGYDVLSSLISVMAFPIDMTAASSGPAQAISFNGLRTGFDSQLANIAIALLSVANQVGATPKAEVKTFTSTATALPSAGNPFTIDLGTCDCPTFYSSDFPFIDYDASVELYLPFIGTMTLDTQSVMGNSLHAYMSVDPITGAVYSWCECTKSGSRVVVAAGTGAIGVNTPITANQVGMAMAQIKNNAARQQQTALQSALAIGIGAFTGVDPATSSKLLNYMATGNKNVASAAAKDYASALSVGASQAGMVALPNAVGGRLNMGRANRQIAQANHNSVSGSAGGSTADWSCSYTPYLKIITPDVHRAGEQYEHTYGVPTILSGTLSTFKGLTFCANPDVSGISTATDQEKQQIFALLSGGVYV